ncbi:hypothetical protein ElyMa_006910600 [Elysia marginata]|uniref:Proteasome assembly chaperone 2 n=1 Tax=Elysia marginata TaxID=1093978 RepID=A0AAV4JHH1_9GAST|nr:hypothetical protein ElyMa_006910600 [Elysia marginata]
MSRTLLLSIGPRGFSCVEDATAEITSYLTFLALFKRNTSTCPDLVRVSTLAGSQGPDLFKTPETRLQIPKLCKFTASQTDGLVDLHLIWMAKTKPDSWRSHIAWVHQVFEPYQFLSSLCLYCMVKRSCLSLGNLGKTGQTTENVNKLV